MCWQLYQCELNLRRYNVQRYFEYTAVAGRLRTVSWSDIIQLINCCNRITGIHFPSSHINPTHLIPAIKTDSIIGRWCQWIISCIKICLRHLNYALPIWQPTKWGIFRQIVVLGELLLKWSQNKWNKWWCLQNQSSAFGHHLFIEHHWTLWYSMNRTPAFLAR